MMAMSLLRGNILNIQTSSIKVIDENVDGWRCQLSEILWDSIHANRFLSWNIVTCTMFIKVFKLVSRETNQPSQMALKNTLTVSLQRDETSFTNDCHGYDTKWSDRFQSWNFGECGVFLYCHYSQFHSDLEC